MSHLTKLSFMDVIQNGMNIFIQGGAATPHFLIRALIEEAPRLRDVTIMHIHTHGDGEYAHPHFEKSFKVVNLFVGSNIRPYLDYDRVDYLPCFLSEIPALFKKGIRPVDVAIIQVSPPDAHGFCTLGTSVDVTAQAVESARIVIAQINPNMPRVHGDGFIHISDIDFSVDVDESIHETPAITLDSDEKKIGQFAAELIEDGSTIQMGIGSIPDAVARALVNHKHLGIHSEMWSDGALELLKKGVVDNSQKVVHPGKTVSSFVLGSRELYDFIDDNPSVIQLGADYVNNPAIIKRNPKVVAINSAVEVDLTGQVCADSVGHRIISGVGGQMDFMRGASLSEGGKGIIAMKSRSPKGYPKIVSTLQPGAGVVTTRSHIQYVITEHGVADLRGKTLGERSRELVNVAHPEDREKLERDFRDNFYHL